MQLKITSQNKQPLLSRAEIMADLTFDKATPSNDDVQKKIAGSLKVDQSLVVIKHIYTSFGKMHASVQAYAYDSAEEKDKFEPKAKKKKGKEQPAEKKEGGK